MQIQNRSDLASTIRDECDSHWREHHSALILQQLGSSLRRNLAPGLDLRKLIPEGLKRFIEASMSDSIEVHESEEKNGTFGITPKNVDKPKDPAELFRRPARFVEVRTHGASGPSRFYHSGFWNAFRDPLRDGYRRFWKPSDPLQYHDVSDDDEAPQDAFEVLRKYIVGIAKMELGDAGRIHAAINQFVSESGISIGVLLSRTQPNARNVEEADQLAYSTLVKGLLALSPSDQARIPVPMDIVLHLLKRRQT